MQSHVLSALHVWTNSFQNIPEAGAFITLYFQYGFMKQSNHGH